MREGVKSHNSISGSTKFPRWEHRGLIENCPDCVAHKEAAKEIKQLRRLEAEEWGIQYCCNGIDCGCKGMPVDPPSWWTPDIKKLQIENDRLKKDRERLEWLWSRNQICHFTGNGELYIESGKPITHTGPARKVIDKEMTK